MNVVVCWYKGCGIEELLDSWCVALNSINVNYELPSLPFIEVLIQQMLIVVRSISKRVTTESIYFMYIYISNIGLFNSYLKIFATSEFFQQRKRRSTIKDQIQDPDICLLTIFYDKSPEPPLSNSVIYSILFSP